MSEPTPNPEAKEEVLPPRMCGQLLNEYNIPTKRLPDSMGVETIEISSEHLQAAVKKLRTSPEVALNLLIAVSGVEQDTAFDSVYHLWSYANTNELVIKVRVPKAEVAEGNLPAVPTLANFWSAANWHERETYDLMGIRYINHPYMRRILNPWDWEGHPLRRDYKQPVDALNDKNPHSMR
jgi:NADH-quinone oxidoreductase subunit C